MTWDELRAEIYAIEEGTVKRTRVRLFKLLLRDSVRACRRGRTQVAATWTRPSDAFAEMTNVSDMRWWLWRLWAIRKQSDRTFDCARHEQMLSVIDRTAPGLIGTRTSAQAVRSKRICDAYRTVFTYLGDLR